MAIVITWEGTSVNKIDDYFVITIREILTNDDPIEVTAGESYTETYYPADVGKYKQALKQQVLARRAKQAEEAVKRGQLESVVLPTFEAFINA